MAMNAHAVKASELFRERVVSRYYSALTHLQRLDQFGPSIDVTDTPSAAEAGYLPRSSHDTALTAFAQLGALRLDASRALISLVDSKYQYVLAEATRSIPLQCDTHHGLSDSLWLGAVAMQRRQEEICEVMLDQVYHAQRSHGEDVPLNVIVIDDLQQDTKYLACPWVVSGPQVRFAVGAPLLSDDGTIIGMFTIFDDRVHSGITDEQESFVRDMATTIMAHLDGVRIQAEYNRRDKLINGLESFTGGLSELRTSLDDPRSRHGTKNRKAGKIARVDAAADEKAAEREDVISPGPASLKSDATNDSSLALWESALPSGSRSMFSRASKIIKQAGDFDGVAFFYISSNFHSEERSKDDHVSVHDKPSQAAHRESTSSSHNSTDDHYDDPAGSTDDGVSDYFVTHKPNNTSNNGPQGSQPCALLACALSDSETQTQASGENRFGKFTQRHLRQVFGKRPRGQLFVLNDQAQALAGDSSNTESELDRGVSTAQNHSDSTVKPNLLSKGRRKKSSKIQSLLKLSPTARSFTVLPLWDFERQRWFAYCVCWSASPRDPSIDGGLNYLKVFGNSIMHALSHIDALAGSRAKTSFVSSISHEMRSPLHGILGANNFLADGQLTSFQEEMVESITSCGRTLLDTLNHVLDYSKINSSSIDNRPRQSRRVDSGARSRPQSSSIPRPPTKSAVNLALLIEEVAEAVVMGFTVQHEFLYPDEKDIDSMDFLQIKPSLDDMVDSYKNIGQRVRVRVVLALTPQQNAFVETEPGAWRRIMMNLFANALKYTSDGLITVRLEAVEDPRNTGYVKAALTVKDTGRGISDDYLQNHLYRPFSQEDSFASGTGLGLSIVKQVVRGMDGTIDVSSSKGIGTTVEVNVSMLRAEPQPSSGGRPDFVGSVFGRMHGLSVCLLEDNASRASVNINAMQRSAESSYSQVLLALLREWFEVEASIQDAWTPGLADIVICLEPSFKHLASVRAGTSDRGNAPPVIFIAYDALEMAALRTDARILSADSVVEILCQPVGPRKLAKSLAQCISRRDKQKNPVSPTRPTPNRQRSDTSWLPVPPPSPERSVKAPRVLICDDNPVNLRLLGAFLKRERASFQEAHNGQEAVDHYIAAHGNIKYVLMDISMPIMDGMTASKKIREHEKEHSLERSAIIALTGLASASARSEAEEAGMDQFLTKPINFKQLQELLRKDAKE